MIAKHIRMRSMRKSSFHELVRYITHAKNKHERILSVAVTNCRQTSPADAALEILAIQHQNTRAESDKTYHLLISFQANEVPSPPLIQHIESELCEALGFREHQRISALHTDTDNLHIHIAINKVHPRHRTIHNPYCDYKTLGGICDQLEKQYGLAHDNHHAMARGAHSPALDMENAGGIESLLGWIRRQCVDQMRAASSWSQLHEVLQQNGLAILEKGNGLVISDQAGRGVKASSVSRDLSKVRLEQRLGRFERITLPSKNLIRAYQPRPMPSRYDTEALFSRYQKEQAQFEGMRSQARHSSRDKKNRLIDAARRQANGKSSAIRMLESDRLSKRILYHLASANLRDKIQAIHTECRNEHKQNLEKYRRRAWLDWLQHRAQQGDIEALSALRARAKRAGRAGNCLTGTTSRSSETAPCYQADGLTKNGTIIYRVGASAIRDDGQRIALSEAIGQEGLKLSLQLAMRRYGSHIAVAGTEEFKAKVLHAAMAARLAVTFADAEMEHQRQTLFSMQSIVEPDVRVQASSAASDTMPLNSAQAAARRYVTEREEKRRFIQDIPSHRCYRPGQRGRAHYAGMRRMDGHPLVLLKTGDSEIVVMPLEEATAARIQRLKVGTKIAFDAKGHVVRARGRSL
jgi:hypothetical protein